MSVITSHILSIKENPDGNMDLPKLLKEKEFLRPKKMARYDYKKYECTFYNSDSVIDYSMAPLDVKNTLRNTIIEEGDWIKIPDFEIERAKQLEAAGFKNVGKDDPTSTYTKFRRELSEDEIESEMGRVVFTSDNLPNCIIWNINYGTDDTPAFVVSKMLPNITFDYEEIIESDLVAHVLIKDGEVVEYLFPAQEEPDEN